MNKLTKQIENILENNIGVAHPNVRSLIKELKADGEIDYGNSIEQILAVIKEYIAKDIIGITEVMMKDYRKKYKKATKTQKGYWANMLFGIGAVRDYQLKKLQEDFDETNI